MGIHDFRFLSRKMNHEKALLQFFFNLFFAVHCIFAGGPRYMRSFYLRLRIGHFSGADPLIYSHTWSYYMRIRYMRANFFSPYLSHITRDTCTVEAAECDYFGTRHF